ncbi:MAG: helix-turn-helix domain-containing protein [Verrucomicrobia bacterium]|nr:helix-turn-helix domain-containing protein [Verrucomicrobiota bacterium]
MISPKPNPLPVVTLPKQVEPFIGKRELCKRLNKKLRTVDDWMKRGLLPYYKIGHSVSFRWSEVEAFLAQNCRVARRTLPLANTQQPLSRRP